MKRADRRKYHYVYKITRFDGKYYIGFHSTDDLNDGYFGSGKYIRRSIKYHGLEKHSIEILEFLPNRKTMKAKEEELVTETVLKDSLCMNLKLGGQGGFDCINSNPVLREKNRLAVKKAHQTKETKEKTSKAGTKGASRLHALAKTDNIKKKMLQDNAKNARLSWTGKKHTEETKRKISKKNSILQSGEKNNQFGKRWVFSEIFKESKIIKISELDSYIDTGWKIGRKMKF